VPKQPAVLDAASLRERVAAFPRWHYALDLGQGVVTPIFDPAHAVRHAERTRHFFEPLSRWLGGLQGRRVLDLGCNAGYWSLCSLDAGAAFVQGVDGRAMHVAQCELVREARGIDASRWSVTQGDVLQCDLGGPWDVALCLGLLYHLDDPLGMLDRLAATGAQVIVVDSEVDPAPWARSRVGTETPTDPRSATASTQVLVPSVVAIARRLEAAGYRVAVLRPRFTDWTGSPDYRGGWRRALIASRGPDLSGLDVETEPIVAPVRQLVRWGRWAARRR